MCPNWKAPLVGKIFIKGNYEVAVQLGKGENLTIRLTAQANV